MSRAHRRYSSTPVALIVAVGLGSLALAGCQEFVGVEPPEDSLFFPTGMVLHPNGRYLYVVNSNFDVTFSSERGGTVTVVDTDTLQVIPESTVRIGSFGGQAVLDTRVDDEGNVIPPEHLYIAVRGDDSVVRLDVSDEGDTLSCNNGSDGLECRIEELDDDPFALVVERIEADPGDLDVGDDPPIIDLLTMTHLATEVITSVSFRDDDIDTNQVRIEADIVVGGADIAIHPRTRDYYAVGRFDDRVRIFRPVVGRKGEVVGVFALGSIPLANPTGDYDSRDIDFSSNGDRAYIAARNPHSVLVLDTSPRDSGGGAMNDLIAQIDLDEPPEALEVVEEATGTFVYVLELGSESVVVVDPVNHLVVDRFLVGDGPATLAVDPSLLDRDSGQGRYPRMYVALFDDNAVGVIDLDPNSPRYRTTVAKIR